MISDWTERVNRTAALAAAALAAAVLVPAGAASANTTPTCITRPEYRQVKKGMTLLRIKHITGIAGHRMAIATSGGYSTQIRNFKTCSPYSAVSMSFDKHGSGSWRMDGKSAVWAG